MNTNNFSHKNGFNKPSNFYNSSSGSQCDLSDALNSQLFNDDVAFEKTVHCSSNARISGPTREPPAKRFKPNPTGSRMRISFDGSEEAFKTHTTPLATHDSCPPGTCQCPLSPEPLSTSIGSVSRTPSTDSQYSRERPSYVPAGDTKQNNIGKEGSSGVESDCGCVGRKERTFSGSTVTSPSLTSTTPNGTGLTRDLSLGREDSVDSADNSSRLPEEAKEPERSKDCRCGEIRVGKVVGTGEDESDKLSGTGRKSVSNPKIRAKLAHKAAHSGCKAEEAISDLGTDDSLLQTLKRAAAEQGFECLSTKCPSEDSPLTYRCPENHIISTKDFPRTRMLSCPKCQKRLDRCMAYAKAHKGKVLNKTFNEYIEYECEQGHVWKIKYSEYMFTTWCSHCSRMRKEDARNKQKEEALKQKERDAEEQERIFEDARRKMVEEEQHKFADYNFLFQSWPSYYYIYSSSNNCLNDESINMLATEKANTYMTGAPAGASTFDDIFLLYKILITSKEMLIAKLWAVPKGELPSFYRKQAVRLHPDKNSHPQAMEAFQKLTECYKICAQTHQQQ